MSISDVSRVSNNSLIVGMNVVDSWWPCGRILDFIQYISRIVIYFCWCYKFYRYMVHFPVRLLIFPVLSSNRKLSLLIWRPLRWNCGIVSPSPRKKDITRSWGLSPSNPSWGLMTNTTAITRSTSLSLFMYVMSLKFYFGAFDEDMVLSLTRWNISSIENFSWFYFTVENLGYMSGGRRSLEMLWCSDLSDLYGGQLLFVGEYW